MKKQMICLAMLLILGLPGCGKAEIPQTVAENEIALEAIAEETVTAPEEADTREKSEPVSQEDKETEMSRLNSKEGAYVESQSDTGTGFDALNAGSGLTREGNSSNPPESVAAADSSLEASIETAENKEQSENALSQPVQSEMAPANPPEAEMPMEPETEQPSEVPEPPSVKDIYDYAFDADAIRTELISLGESMGLAHITDDDGIPCTPDTCSWASPVTASESFQGDQLKRALCDYVTSMPALLASYGGTEIAYFTIYVQDNGGGSYTFYFLY